MEKKKDTDGQGERERERGRGGKKEVRVLIFGLGFGECRRLPQNNNLGFSKALERAQMLGTPEAPNHQATVKIVWFVIKNTSAVSPWNSVTQSARLGALPVHIWA